MYIRCPPRPEAYIYMQALMLLQRIDWQRAPSALMGGGRSGRVSRQYVQPERERKRGERIAVTNLRTPDEI